MRFLKFLSPVERLATEKSRVRVDLAGTNLAEMKPVVGQALGDLAALNKKAAPWIPLPSEVKLDLSKRVGVTEADPSTNTIAIAARHRKTPGVVLHEAGHLMQNAALMREKQTGAAKALQTVNGAVIRATRASIEATSAIAALEQTRAKMTKAEFKAIQPSYDAQFNSLADVQDRAFANLRAAEAKAEKSFKTLMPYYEMFADTVATMMTRDPEIMARSSNNPARSFSKSAQVRRDERDPYAMLQPFRNHLWKHYLSKPKYRDDGALLARLNRVLLGDISESARPHRQDSSVAEMNRRLMRAFDHEMGRKGIATPITITD